MYISQRYQDMSNIYKQFSESDKSLDFSRDSLEQMYLFESKGIKFDNPVNGYFQGKKWMDVSIEMWNSGIKQGIITKWELSQEFPVWFLDKVIKY